MIKEGLWSYRLEVAFSSLKENKEIKELCSILGETMLPDVLLWGLSFKLKFSVKPENGRGKTWNLWEEQDSFFFCYQLPQLF